MIDLKDTRGQLTPARAIASGIVAGGLGTAAMDTWLFAQYRHGNGTSRFRDWELSVGVSKWEDAPAPAQVGRRLVDGLFQVHLPSTRARLVNNVTHWAFGMAAGAQYGVIAGSLRAPRIRSGLPLGAAVWGSGYVVLPAMKLYEPIWKYDVRTLAKDLTAHLVYGLATAASMRLLTK